MCDVFDERQLREFVCDVISRAVEGVFANLADIDEAIAAHLRGWTIQRLSRVDLSIMRLAVYEIKYAQDIPAAASINEALELSHVYSTDKAAPLINGVLGAIGREQARA